MTLQETIISARTAKPEQLVDLTKHSHFIVRMAAIAEIKEQNIKTPNAIKALQMLTQDNTPSVKPYTVSDYAFAVLHLWGEKYTGNNDLTLNLIEQFEKDNA